jgi:hypothetical protein
LDQLRSSIFLEGAGGLADPNITRRLREEIAAISTRMQAGCTKSEAPRSHLGTGDSSPGMSGTSTPNASPTMVEHFGKPLPKNLPEGPPHSRSHSRHPTRTSGQGCKHPGQSGS